MTENKTMTVERIVLELKLRIIIIIIIINIINAVFLILVSIERE